MEKMKAHLDQWNWDTACWGEGNVITMKKMMKGVCEECMKLPKNEFPAHALPKLSAALHSPGVAMKLHSMIPANFQQVGNNTTTHNQNQHLFSVVYHVPVRPADAQHA